jgi:NAD(P)H-hydrate repair Nnr-like enzyme with NAD(P)H-hydrate epimerase domain
MAERHTGPGNNAGDDFQQAAAAALSDAGHARWLAMSPREQTRAIYSHLRRLDAARAPGMSNTARRSRLRAVTGPTKRVTPA